MAKKRPDTYSPGPDDNTELEAEIARKEASGEVEPAPQPEKGPKKYNPEDGLKLAAKVVEDMKLEGIKARNKKADAENAEKLRKELEANYFGETKEEEEK